MGTHRRLSAIDQPLPRRAVADDDAWADVPVPGWEEFTAARDRFFAGLRPSAALAAEAEVRSHRRRLRDATD